MRPRSPSSLLATAMSSRPLYRGGRNQYRRGFSDSAYDNSGSDQFVSGDAHIRSVRDDNRGRGRFDVRPRPHNHRPPPEFNHNFRPSPYQQVQFGPPMTPRFDQNQSFRPPPEFSSHLPRPKQQFGPPPPNRPMASNQNQQFRPHFKKPVDYRNWEYARDRPPGDCERFTVLSYNILADYLAIDHWSKLYFHIPRHMMDWEWRKRNIIFELGLWSADILCFQEVDRFQDLEEELKVRGYCGTWKMRTGNPVDGCAVFWRTSRFKLLHEESIEFNKLGLRDNVAQICVLEVNQNDKRYKPAVDASIGGSSKVVIGNIHVLYNPKRGEIKLGQVRVFLDRAYAVSKLWDDAPVVLCGDFNCTPKSPLYNYISEQKLELSGLPRNRLSGQASAEIHKPRPYIPNLSNRPINVPTVIEDMEGRHLNMPTDNSVQSPIVTDARKVGQSEAPLDIQKSNDPDSTKRNSSEPHCIISVQPDSSASCNVEDKDEKIPYNDEALHIPSTEHHQLNLSDKNEIINGGTEINDHHCSTKSFLEPTGAGNLKLDLASSDNVDKTSLHNVLESADEGSTGQLSSLGVTNKNLYPTPHENEISTSNHFLLDEKIDDDLFGKVIEAEEIGTPGEDRTSFLSKLHGDFRIPSEFSHDSEFNSSECIGPNQHVSISENQELNPCVGDLNDYRGVGFDQVDVERTTYDPSMWTPMEIEAATGCADCTLMESPLKLRSTYSEVEDSSGTRDSSGEPLVTSYNRCFLGTVDYIWRSEGLQTVRALAPIPKHAMQWTSGFPTKKWGSDHLALVSELAFTKKTDNQVGGL